MSAALALPYVTEAEFLALPESQEHRELLDGEIVLMPSPLPIHQNLVGFFYRRICHWADGHPPVYVGLSPLDIRLGPDRILQPDLCVFLAGCPGDGHRLITGVPDLVVEVMSERRGYDRLTKRLVYAEAGVQEYWIVDPFARTVEVVYGLRTDRVETERLSSDLLPGLDIDLRQVWPV